MSTLSTITHLCSHNQTANSFLQQVTSFTPHYTLGFPKDPGNWKGILPFASQAQESLEMGSALWSVKFPQTAREDALSNAADDPPPKKKMVALSKLKMLHWKFWKYEIWLRSKTEPCGKPENSLSLSAETTAEKTLNRTQPKAYGQGREHGNKNRINGKTHRDVFFLKVT